MKIANLLLLFVFAGSMAFAPKEAFCGSPEAKNTVVAPLVQERYEYYDVSGADEKELICSITEKCSTGKDGNKYDSVTKWRISWDYGHELRHDVCYASSFRLTVDVILRMPKWVKKGSEPRALADKWDAYMKKLTAHENGHRDIVLEAAADLTRAIRDLPPGLSCEELDRNIQQLCRQRLRKLEEDQHAYDAANGHGLHQGAVFP